MTYAASDYASAAIAEPFNVLGVRLKPLSINHCILMQRFGVPFVDKSESDATLGDLVLAILICSEQWEDGEFDAYIFSKKAERDIASWSRKIGSKSALEDAKLFSVPEKIALFNQYVQEASKEPAYWDGDNSGGKPSGAHWTQCVLLTLTAHLGYTRKEALHCPLKQALADYFRHAEINGAVRLIPADVFNRSQSGEEDSND